MQGVWVQSLLGELRSLTPCGPKPKHKTEETLQQIQCLWVVQSHPTLWSHWLWPTRLLCLQNSPGTNTGVGCHSLLQNISPTQGLNPALPHHRQIVYHLSHKGSPNSIKTLKIKLFFKKSKWNLPINHMAIEWLWGFFLLVFFFFFLFYVLWDLSSPARKWTWALDNENAES